MNIIPIKDLKDTSKIDALCQSTDEPIYVTKNGYDSMVIMGSKAFEAYLAEQRELAVAQALRKLELAETIADIQTSEDDIAAGRVRDGFEMLEELRSTYGL